MNPGNEKVDRGAALNILNSIPSTHAFSMPPFRLTLSLSLFLSLVSPPPLPLRQLRLLQRLTFHRWCSSPTVWCVTLRRTVHTYQDLSSRVLQVRHLQAGLEDHEVFVPPGEYGFRIQLAFVSVTPPRNTI